MRDRRGGPVRPAVDVAAVVRRQVQTDGCTGVAVIVDEHRVGGGGFVVRGVEGGFQDRVLKLLTRGDDVQPVVEHRQIDGVAEDFVDVQRELQPVAGPEVRQPQY